MSDMKTQPTRKSVKKFLAGQDKEVRRKDSVVLLEMMQEITGQSPVLWGESLVGFGSYHYKYASGREGDWPVTAFSPRKASMVVYIMPGFKKYQSLLDKLGKHKHSSSCLYISKLGDVKLSVLKQLIARSVKDMRKMYPTEP
jgi:hypothetical protein